MMMIRSSPAGNIRREREKKGGRDSWELEFGMETKY